MSQSSYRFHLFNCPGTSRPGLGKLRISGVSTFLLALIAVLINYSPVSAQDAEPWQQALSVGAFYARGQYGEPVDTRIRYLPLTYEANRGAWGFQLMVPRLEVTGLGNVLINIGGVTQSVAGTEVTTSRGIGDSVASLIYRFDPWSATAPFIDLRFDIKLPTADETRALGTGEADYSLQFDFSKAVGEAAVFATAGYNIRGKTDLYAGLQDSAFLQLGVATPFSDRVNAGLFYDYRQAASEYSEETHEIVPYFSWQLSESWSFTGLTIWGFTDASADLSVMGQLRYSW